MDKLSPQEFPLNEALQEVLQQGATRARQTRSAQHELYTLQACLLELERRCESVCSEVRLKETRLTALRCEMEALRSSSAGLESGIQSVLMENLRLRSALEDEQQRSRSQQQEFGSHLSRIQAFRSAASLRDSRAHVGQELKRRQQEVCELRTHLEELKTDLQNTHSGAARQTQKEIDLLKMNIHEARQTVKERRARVESEEQKQTQLRREIEIQRRRCEAVRRRLRCELQKSQTSHRTLRCEVSRLQEELQTLTNTAQGDNYD